jgi:hypothetical protein
MRAYTAIYNPVFQFFQFFLVFQKAGVLVFSFFPLLRGKLKNWKITDFPGIFAGSLNALYAAVFMDGIVSRTKNPLGKASITLWPGVLAGMIKTPANNKNPLHYCEVNYEI